MRDLGVVGGVLGCSFLVVFARCQVAFVSSGNVACERKRGLLLAVWTLISLGVYKPKAELTCGNSVLQGIWGGSFRMTPGACKLRSHCRVQQRM